MTDQSTAQTTAIDRYGVMGYPISHSRSPVIHRLFALQTRENLQYELLQVSPEKMETAIRQFQRTGGKGLNITVPHKTEVTKLVDKISDRAATAGAVNTLSFRGGEVHGDNTDGIGNAARIAADRQSDPRQSAIAGRSLFEYRPGIRLSFQCRSRFHKVRPDHQCDVRRRTR